MEGTRLPEGINNRGKVLGLQDDPRVRTPRRQVVMEGTAGRAIMPVGTV